MSHGLPCRLGVRRSLFAVVEREMLHGVGMTIINALSGPWFLDASARFWELAWIYGVGGLQDGDWSGFGASRTPIHHQRAHRVTVL
jgi:hypothetical protein